MSGALPDVDFKALNFTSEQRTLRSTTDSGKTFRRQIDGQRWAFTLSYPLKTRTEFAPIQAFIINKDQAKKILLSLSQVILMLKVQKQEQ